jgi:hypothetical protein
MSLEGFESCWRARSGGEEFERLGVRMAKTKDGEEGRAKT